MPPLVPEIGLALSASAVGVLVPAIACGMSARDTLSALTLAAIAVLAVAALVAVRRERRAVVVRDHRAAESLHDSAQH